MLACGPAWADSDYYTWVDEQGRVHNSPKPGSLSADEKAANKVGEKGESNSAEPDGIAVDPDDFPDEAEVERRQQQYQQENPPFYIWVDEQGVTHRQTYRSGEGKADSAPEEAVFDHILIPPFRLKNAPQSCCERYLFAFKDSLPVEKMAAFSSFARAQPFLWQQPNKKPRQYRGWYFALAGQAQAPRQLRLVSQGEGLRPALLLLNDQLQPLYWLPKLNGVQQAASWARVAQFESLLEIRDSHVRYVIALVPEAQAKQPWSLTAQWFYGTTSD